jgi:hypothetical protein
MSWVSFKITPKKIFKQNRKRKIKLKQKKKKKKQTTLNKKIDMEMLLEITPFSFVVNQQKRQFFVDFVLSPLYFIFPLFFSSLILICIVPFHLFACSF